MYPEVEISGCLFHLRKAIWAQIGKLGLQPLFYENVEFQELIYKIYSLCYVHPDQVVQVYEDEIMPVLENMFKRITLVEKNQKERITIDYNLRFLVPGGSGALELPGISIAEIKREGNLAASRFNSVLRENRIYPMRFSKYCMGLAMLNPDLPQNRFKAKIMKLDKINNAYQP